MAARECADKGGCEDSVLLVFGKDEREARELGSMEVLEREGIQMRCLPIQK